MFHETTSGILLCLLSEENSKNGVSLAQGVSTRFFFTHDFIYESSFVFQNFMTDYFISYVLNNLDNLNKHGLLLGMPISYNTNMIMMIGSSTEYSV
jgi:hypothetical protein